MSIHLRFIVASIAAISSPAQAQNLFATFMQSYNTKDYKTCVESGTALITRYDHPDLNIQLSECYYGLKEFEKADEIIKKLAEKGVMFDSTKMPDTKSTSVEITLTLFDENLVPEGIAYDPSAGTFYVGSLAQNKIITINKKGEQREFFTPPGEHKWQFAGMRVIGNQLWACAFSEYSDNDGQSAVFSIDIKTGKLTDAFYMRNGAHLLNDLVQGPAGEMYITDSKAGMVYRLKDSAFQPITENSFIYPNGIAINPAGDKLFVADWTGITVIDVKTNAATKLESSFYVNSIDGLYWHNGDLIAVQHIRNLERVVRIKLMDNKISGITELTRESGPGIPTTGVIVGEDLFYIANSFVASVKANGVIENPENLKTAVIKKISLK